MEEKQLKQLVRHDPADLVNRKPVRFPHPVNFGIHITAYEELGRAQIQVAAEAIRNDLRSRRNVVL